LTEKWECGERYSIKISGISEKINGEYVTLSDFLEILGPRGQLVGCMLLATPFLIPISIPGTGMVVGFIIFITSISIIFNQGYLIPKRFLNHKFSRESIIKALNTSFRVLNRLEKYMKPRLLIMTNQRAIRGLNSFMLILSTIFFMLPLPIPLTDTMPALGVFCLSAGTLECDGYLILAGYLVVGITAVYFGLVIWLGWSGLSTFSSYYNLSF
jgi:hypothetical protein